MSNLAGLQSAIFTRLSGNWTSTPVHWPGTHFEPRNAAYIQPRVHSSQITQAELGPDGENEIIGFLSVNVIAPIGVSNATAWGYVDTLRGLFPRGLTLTNSTKQIQFEAPDVAPSIEEQDWLIIPITCRFRQFESRT